MAIWCGWSGHGSDALAAYQFRPLVDNTPDEEGRSNWCAELLPLEEWRRCPIRFSVK